MLLGLEAEETDIIDTIIMNVAKASVKIPPKLRKNRRPE